jgi:Ribosomal protein L7/L12 C-terminal domain
MDDDSPKSGAAPPLSAAALAAIQQGRTIEAIKIVRQERGIGLKEAKDIVDGYVHSRPGALPARAGAGIEAQWSALLWLAAFIALAIVAYYFLHKP